MTDKEKLDFIDDYNKAIQDSHKQDEIQCDYCSKIVKKYVAIDTWMITEYNKNVCYKCQIQKGIGWGKIK